MSADVLVDRCDSPPQLLEPERLPDHLDVLYRAARAMRESRYDTEDLVQVTFASVLRRPRWIRHGNEHAHLLRALKHTYASRVRTAAFRAATVQLFEHDAPSCSEDRASSRELVEAIASAPAPYRDAVIAVDVLGLSYREAARSLHTRETTITSRLHRGRQHIARMLLPDGTPPPRALPNACGCDRLVRPALTRGRDGWAHQARANTGYLAAARCRGT